MVLSLDEMPKLKCNLIENIIFQPKNKVETFIRHINNMQRVELITRVKYSDIHVMHISVM